MRVKVSLFGPPEISIDDSPISINRRKVQALLIYLVENGQAQSRDSLAALFWPETDQSTARTNLRRELSRLRQLVGDELLEVDRAQVRFHLEDVSIDTAEFKALNDQVKLLQQGKDILCAECVGLLQTAVSLYTDHFLAGFALSDSPEFDEWQFFLRESYQQTLGTHLEKLIAAFVARADFEQGIEYGRRWVALDPLHEPAQRELMKLYAWNGQQAAALRQYQTCEQVLEEELGVEPEPETEELIELIRTRKLETPEAIVVETAVVQPEAPEAPQPEPEAGRLLKIPADPNPFLGRKTEIEKIQEMLVQPDCRLLTIIGLGGMGKSRLAMEVGKAVYETDRFDDGVAFISLAGVRSPSAVPSAIADTLGLNLSGSQEPLAQLVNKLKSRSMLLISDNFEHLLSEEHLEDGAEILEQLLNDCPKIQLLVTSREPLNMASEYRFVIDGLPFPAAELAEENTLSAEAYPAVNLFVQSAAQIYPDFSLDEENQETIVRICEMSQGMPLAIKIAATWLRAISLERIVDEMTRNLNILTTRMRDLPLRQRSMRAIFDYSWDLLIEPEQQLFQALSVFRGGFTEDAAEKVAGSSPFLLAGLVDRGLVQRPYSDGSRYQMHELTRQYAHERLMADTVSQKVYQAYARYFADFVAERTDSIWAQAFQEAADQITVETHNVHHAWDWLIEQIDQDDQPLAELLLPHFATVMERYYFLKRPYFTGNKRFSAIIDQMKQYGWDSAPEDSSCQTVLAQYQLSASVFWGSMGEYHHIDEHFQTAIPQLEKYGSVREHGMALTMQAKANLLRGKRELAKEQLQQSLPLLKQAKDVNGASDTLKVLGVVEVDSGNYEETLAYYEDALEGYREIGFKPGIAAVLYNMGTALIRMDKLPESKEKYEESQKIAKEIQYDTILMQAKGSLAGVYKSMGQLDVAERYYHQAIEMAEKVGHSRFYEVNVRGLGLNYLAQNRLVDAEKTFKRAIQLSEEMADMPEILSGFMTLANAWAKQGKIAEALKLAMFIADRPEMRAIDNQQNDVFLSELKQELRPYIIDEAVEWAEVQTVDDVLKWIFA